MLLNVSQIDNGNRTAFTVLVQDPRVAQGKPFLIGMVNRDSLSGHSSPYVRIGDPSSYSQTSFLFYNALLTEKVFQDDTSLPGVVKKVLNSSRARALASGNPVGNIVCQMYPIFRSMFSTRSVGSKNQDYDKSFTRFHKQLWPVASSDVFSMADHKGRVAHMYSRKKEVCCIKYRVKADPDLTLPECFGSASWLAESIHQHFNALGGRTQHASLSNWMVPLGLWTSQVGMLTFKTFMLHIAGFPVRNFVVQEDGVENRDLVKAYASWFSDIPEFEEFSLAASEERSSLYSKMVDAISANKNQRVTKLKNKIRRAKNSKKKTTTKKVFRLKRV